MVSYFFLIRPFCSKCQISKLHGRHKKRSGCVYLLQNRGNNGGENNLKVEERELIVLSL